MFAAAAGQLRMAAPGRCGRESSGRAGALRLLVSSAGGGTGGSSPAAADPWAAGRPGLLRPSGRVPAERRPGERRARSAAARYSRRRRVGFRARRRAQAKQVGVNDVALISRRFLAISPVVQGGRSDRKASSGAITASWQPPARPRAAPMKPGGLLCARTAAAVRLRPRATVAGEQLTDDVIWPGSAGSKSGLHARVFSARPSRPLRSP